MLEFKKHGLYYSHQDRKRVAVMLIGKVRMIYLLTAMLAVGAGAGFASHEDTRLQKKLPWRKTRRQRDTAPVLWKKSITDSVRLRKN